jgi:DNA-binding IclR family transcriptional regulator
MSMEPVAGSQTLDRALTVLLEIAKNGERGLSLAECSAILGYSKATTHRILRTLSRREFVRLDEERGLYSLGITNLRLGMGFLERLDLRREAIPVLRELAALTGETVHLGTISGTDVVYIEKVESPKAVRMFSRVGDTMPAYSTGIGKAILAFLPDAELEEHLPARLERRTPTTIVDRGELRVEFSSIRERGYSTDNIENEDGIRCVGAPIFDHSAVVCGAISVAGPANRVGPERFEELGRMVRQRADEISVRIGHAPDAPTVA